MILPDFQNEGKDRSSAQEDSGHTAQPSKFKETYQAVSLKMLDEYVEKGNLDAVLNFLPRFPMEKSKLETLIVFFRKQYDDTNLEIEREQDKSPANGNLIIELEQKFTKLGDIVELLQKKIDKL